MLLKDVKICKMKKKKILKLYMKHSNIITYVVLITVIILLYLYNQLYESFLSTTFNMDDLNLSNIKKDVKLCDDICSTNCIDKKSSIASADDNIKKLNEMLANLDSQIPRIDNKIKHFSEKAQTELANVHNYNNQINTVKNEKNNNVNIKNDLINTITNLHNDIREKRQQIENHRNEINRLKPIIQGKNDEHQRQTNRKLHDLNNKFNYEINDIDRKIQHFSDLYHNNKRTADSCKRRSNGPCLRRHRGRQNEARDQVNAHNDYRNKLTMSHNEEKKNIMFIARNTMNDNWHPVRLQDSYINNLNNQVNNDNTMIGEKEKLKNNYIQSIKENNSKINSLSKTRSDYQEVYDKYNNKYLDWSNDKRTLDNNIGIVKNEVKQNLNSRTTYLNKYVEKKNKLLNKRLDCTIEGFTSTSGNVEDGGVCKFDTDCKNEKMHCRESSKNNQKKCLTKNQCIVLREQEVTKGNLPGNCMSSLSCNDRKRNFYLYHKENGTELKEETASLQRYQFDQNGSCDTQNVYFVKPIDTFNYMFTTNEDLEKEYTELTTQMSQINKEKNKIERIMSKKNYV